MIESGSWKIGGTYCDGKGYEASGRLDLFSFFRMPASIVIPTKPLDKLGESNGAWRDLQFWFAYTIS
jgi:hypothetical protein